MKKTLIYDGGIEDDFVGVLKSWLEELGHDEGQLYLNSSGGSIATTEIALSMLQQSSNQVSIYVGYELCSAAFYLVALYGGKKYLLPSSSRFVIHLPTAFVGYRTAGSAIANKNGDTDAIKEQVRMFLASQDRLLKARGLCNTKWNRYKRGVDIYLDREEALTLLQAEALEDTCITPKASELKVIDMT